VSAQMTGIARTPPSTAFIMKPMATKPRLCRRCRPLPGPCSKHGSHRSRVMNSARVNRCAGRCQEIA
jgi:hypothetical protein